MSGFISEIHLNFNKSYSFRNPNFVPPLPPKPVHQQKSRLQSKRLVDKTKTPTLQASAASTVISLSSPESRSHASSLPNSDTSSSNRSESSQPSVRPKYVKATTTSSKKDLDPVYANGTDLSSMKAPILQAPPPTFHLIQVSQRNKIGLRQK